VRDHQLQEARANSDKGGYSSSNFRALQTSIKLAWAGLGFAKIQNLL